MYTKATAPRIIDVVLKFDSALNEDPMIFPCHRTSRGKKDLEDQMAALGDEIQAIDWLADTAAEPPIGFADFPLTAEEKVKLLADEPNGDGPKVQHKPEYKAVVEATPAVEKPLAERIRMYFLDQERPELLDYVAFVRGRYYRIVLPTFPV